MSSWPVEVLLVVAGYGLGCFPTAALVGRWVGRDPTREGSRNPGASNVYRVAGARAGAIVLAVDVAKGAAAAAIGHAASGRGLAIACGAAAVVGHVLPITRLGKAGKGVATAVGLIIVVEPWLAAGLALVWAVAAAATRYAAVASLTAIVGLPVGAALLGRPGREVAAFAGVAALVAVRHADNVRRLLRGEERRLAYRRSR